MRVHRLFRSPWDSTICSSNRLELSVEQLCSVRRHRMFFTSSTGLNVDENASRLHRRYSGIQQLQYLSLSFQNVLLPWRVKTIAFPADHGAAGYGICTSTSRSMSHPGIQRRSECVSFTPEILWDPTTWKVLTLWFSEYSISLARATIVSQGALGAYEVAGYWL